MSATSTVVSNTDEKQIDDEKKEDLDASDLQTIHIKDLQWKSVSIKDQIIKADSKWQQYEKQLSKINDAKIKDLDKTDLKEYGITTLEHRKQIYKIIQQIIVDYKALKSKEYEDLRKSFQNKMGKLLQTKTKKDLKKECGDTDCNAFKELKYGDLKIKLDDIKYEEHLKEIDINNIDCESFQRIKVILDIYDKLINSNRLWNKIPIAALISINDQYSHQQLHDDFLHIVMVHCQSGNYSFYKTQQYKPSFSNGIYGAYTCYHHSQKTLKDILCKRFAETFKCDIQRCYYRERNNEKEENLYYKKLGKLSRSKSMEIVNDKDIVFQQECNKIHSFFLHPPELFIAGSRRHNNRIIRQQNDTDSVKSEEKTSSSSPPKSIYIGAQEDKQWFEQIEPEENKESDKWIYKRLVKKMGVFRWQSAHGFRPGQNRNIGQLKPKYANIKEEALNNDYHPLRKDDWNQTLRKSKIFYQSWARQKIRTQSKGYFDDKVTGHYKEWEKAEEILMSEIVTLKLYTDFDKLQFALKKCFRFETYRDILADNSLNTKEDTNNKCKEREKKTRYDLEQRLRNFYHWRGGLMIVLSKFGTKLSRKPNMTLYHGVNAKMIISPTETFGFYGPLSTTTSEHVARTFATAKGMVLKVTSYFPRLNYCNAFDASLISDYPEEQEWLVGFMYVRVLEIKTRELVKNAISFTEIMNKVPIASWIRQEFFAIHLFREQMFSMSEHLERMQAAYLRCNRDECCSPAAKKKYEYTCINDGCWFKRLDCICYYGAKHKEAPKEWSENHNKCIYDDKVSEEERKERQLNWKRKLKLYPILWKKFEYFRESPNKEQCIKFDNISDILKRFFMEQIDERDINTKQKKWIISFDEITTVYPKVKEIHFINQYKFDKHVLQRLINQIRKKGKGGSVEKNNINKIVFSYYNYTETKDNMPSNDKLDVNMLDELHKLEWYIKRQEIKQKQKEDGSTGYKITVYKKQKKP